MSEGPLDIEAGLVAQIFATGDLVKVLENRIKPEFLYGPSRMHLAFIIRYFKQYGQLPSEGVMKRNFPDFELEQTEEPLQYFCDELRRRQKYNMMVQGIKGIATCLDTRQVDEAFKKFQAVASDITVNVHSTRDVDITKNAEDRWEEYLRVKDSLGMVGIPYPWEVLNNATGGMSDEELITIFGFAGSGKTWTLLYVLYHAWLSGKKVLMVTKEMPVQQLQRRFDALNSSLPYQAFKMGQLGEQLEQSWREDMEHLKDKPSFVITSDDEGGLGVSGVRTKIEQHSPDIIGIDGVYLLEDDRRGEGWERIRNITQDLKRLARDVLRPVVVTTQASEEPGKRKGLRLSSTAFYKSFAQDSDVVIGVEPMQANWKLRVLKVREGIGPVIVINRDFEKMRFDQCRVEYEDVNDSEDDDTIMY